jgi:hypothetical protein
VDIFIRRGLKKPAHVERVKLQLHPVKCVCGSVFYASPGLLEGDKDRCPDCGELPRPGRVSALEEVDLDVPVVFGNVGAVVPSRSRR